MLPEKLAFKLGDIVITPTYINLAPAAAAVAKYEQGWKPVSHENGIFYRELKEN